MHYGTEMKTSAFHAYTTLKLVLGRKCRLKVLGEGNAHRTISDIKLFKILTTESNIELNFRLYQKIIRKMSF